MLRLPLLNEILTRIAQASPAELISLVGTSYRSHYRQSCRSVSWAHPLPQLQVIAVCVGGRGLAAIFRALAVNHKQLGSGMPDLLLLRVTHRPSIQQSALQQPSLPTVGTATTIPAPLTCSPSAADTSVDWESWLGLSWDTSGSLWGTVGAEGSSRGGPSHLGIDEDLVNLCTDNNTVDSKKRLSSKSGKPSTKTSREAFERVQALKKSKTAANNEPGDGEYAQS